MVPQSGSTLKSKFNRTLKIIRPMMIDKNIALYIIINRIILIGE